VSSKTAELNVAVSERRAWLAWRHRLLPARRVQDPAVIADDLVALHSSDPVSVYLSVWARQLEPSVASVEAALYENRSLLRHHAMRRTIWVMTPANAQVAHVACTMAVAARERRRLLDWLDGDEAWLADATAEVVALVDAEGPLTTRHVGLRLPHIAVRTLTVAPGTRSGTEMPAHPKVLQQAGFDGVLVRTRPQGTWIGSQYAWATMKSWTGVTLNFPGSAGAACTPDPTKATTVTTPDPTEAAETATATTTEAAEAALARAWLSRFGPATQDDLQWWAGWSKRVTKRALQAIDAVPVQMQAHVSGAAAGTADSAGGALNAAVDGWMMPDQAESRASDGPLETPDPWVALLPGLDPAVMGYKMGHPTRSWYLDDSVAARVTDRSGNIGPTVWADGRIVGGWAQRRDGSIATEIRHDISNDHRRLLDAEVARLREAIGMARFRPRYPPPNQKDLVQ